MASHRRPKGTVIRHVPDWNSDKLAYNNDWWVGLVSSNTLSVLLFNDSNTGSKLIVWALDIVQLPTNWPNQNGIAATGGMLQGVSTASFISPTFMLNPTQAVIHGKVYGQLVASPTGLTDESRTFGLSAGGYCWPHDWPCAIIPAGWSFGVDLHGEGGQMAVGFVWEEILLT